MSQKYQTNALRNMMIQHWIWGGTLLVPYIFGQIHIICLHFLKALGEWITEDNLNVENPACVDLFPRVSHRVFHIYSTFNHI